MDKLDPNIRFYIFRKLTAKGISNLSLTSQFLNQDIERFGEKIFEEKLKQEYGLSKFCDIKLEQKYQGYRETYIAFYKLGLQKYGSMVPFAISTISRLMKYLKDNYQTVYQSFQQGVSEQELDQFEEATTFKIPLAARLLLRIINGQVVPNGAQKNYMGALGGHFVYNQDTTTYLLQLKDIQYIYNTINIPEYKALTTKFLFASDCRFSKTLLLGENGVESNLEYQNQFPLQQNAQQGKDNDNLFQWLLKYVENLENGVFQIQTRAVRESEFKYISLYPQVAPLLRNKLSNNILIQVSVAVVPETSNFSDDRITFSYQVGFSMPLDSTKQDISDTLGQQQQKSQQKFKQQKISESEQSDGIQKGCQLYKRRWVIREIKGPEIQDEVYDKAVIGMYPILYPGCPEFKYSSQVQFSKEGGYMDGHFDFLDGIDVNVSKTDLAPLKEPKIFAGQHIFKAECPRFFMKLPEYVF